jgi:chorismate dehydratase
VNGRARIAVRAGKRMLRVGCVKYLNARPLIRGWDGEVDFDHPSALCNKLAAGKLDVALVSSFEFLRNPIYRIVNDVSISSDGPVYSVVVAHRGKISDIEDIELDPASETSTNLLRSLLAECGLNPHLVQGNGPKALEAKHSARLLIGDQAIRFRQEYVNEFSFWDLGEQWQKLFNVPFVYALWLIRPEVADPEQIANRLRNLRDENLAHLDDLVAETVTGVDFSHCSYKAKADDPNQRGVLNREFFFRYYREHLQFGLGERAKEGLRTFAKLCTTHDLIPKREHTFRVV